MAALAFLLSDRIREGADVGVDALTWRIARPHEVAFTLGPGPWHLTRTASASELRFSTDPHVASTPLAVRAVLPRQGDAADLSGRRSGVPLTARSSGGRRGLMDVAHATTTGRAHVVLAEDGSAVTFDGEGGVRGLSLSNPRLATDVVQGLDLQVQVRGAATADGDLRLDDLAATFGAVHIAAGGVLEQRPDHVAAALHFDVPRASCQSLLDSLPSALLPALQGTRFAGTSRPTGVSASTPGRSTTSSSTTTSRTSAASRRSRPSLPESASSSRSPTAIYLPDGIDGRGDDRSRHRQLDAARRDQPVHAGRRAHDRRRRVSASTTASTGRRSARRSSPTSRPAASLAAPAPSRCSSRRTSFSRATRPSRGSSRRSS